MHDLDESLALSEVHGGRKTWYWRKTWYQAHLIDDAGCGDDRIHRRVLFFCAALAYNCKPLRAARSLHNVNVDSKLPLA